MKRKTIAVCISGFHPNSEAKILNEIILNAKKEDINVLVFTSLMIKGDFPKGIDYNSNLVRGESEIFHLINYELIDGLIIFGNSIYNENIIFEIEKNCEEHKIPVINVNDPTHIMEHNVNVENSFAMSLVVEHLITVHKLTKINFISGYPGNKESEERLNAYKAILTKYNIPVEEKRIGYGHFWKASIECAKKFEKEGLPEAIICANDTMAILVSDYLKSRGYKIPEDIIITGFDGISEAFDYCPSITTVEPKYSAAGQITYETIKALMDGKTVEKNITVGSELITQESCGCVQKKDYHENFVDVKFEKTPALQAFHKHMTRSGVFFSDEETIDELICHVSVPLDYFNLKSFCYCIDYNLEHKKDYWSDTKNKKYGLPSKVIAGSAYYLKIEDNNNFPSKNIMWYDFLDKESAVLSFFSPMYYRNHSLGYMIYEPVNYLTMDFDLFQLWAFNAVEKIGTFYLMGELEELYVKDHLTGLYNRRGMEKYFDQIYRKFERQNGYLSIICADIDYLKTINDKYGHEAGDNAIVQVAKAISKVFGKNSICVRTGGDEFTILVYDTKLQNIDRLIEKVTNTLKLYNEKSELNYSVMCSCGYITLSTDDFTSFEQMEKIADERLYQVKASHHRRRKTDK